MVGTIGGLDSHHDLWLDRGQRGRSLGRAGDFRDAKPARRFSRRCQSDTHRQRSSWSFWRSDRPCSALLALRSKLSSNVLARKPVFNGFWLLWRSSFLCFSSIVISWALSTDWLAALGTTRDCMAFRRKQDQLADPNSWRVQLFVVRFSRAPCLLFGIVIGFLHQCEQVLPSRNLSEPADPRVSCRVAHDAQTEFVYGV